MGRQQQQQEGAWSLDVGLMTRECMLMSDLASYPTGYPSSHKCSYQLYTKPWDVIKRIIP